MLYIKVFPNFSTFLTTILRFKNYANAFEKNQNYRQLLFIRIIVQ